MKRRIKGGWYGGVLQGERRKMKGEQLRRRRGRKRT